MLDAWLQALENIKPFVSESDYCAWIKPTHYSHHDGPVVYISVPSIFFKEWLEEHYQSILSAEISKKYGQAVTLNIIVRCDDNLMPQSTEETANKDTSAIKTDRIPKREPLFNVLDQRYTFDQFVTGASNEIAYGAALDAASNPGKSYNPLFIYGGGGLGKSHLLNSIGHTMRESSPKSNICYSTSEKFLYEMVKHIKSSSMEKFRDFFRTADVLLIDDIQFISKKYGMQEELFHTFDALYEMQKQIVITSDKIPKEIGDIEARLRTRFEWGLIVGVQLPDVKTRIAILKKKSEASNIFIPEEVFHYLASYEVKSVRELEGMLIRLRAYSSIRNIPITMSFAEESLRDLVCVKQKEISIDLIQKVVSDYFSIELKDIKSEKRQKNIVHARQISIWLCRDMTESSYPDIGSKFGKDHSTIIHSFKKVDKMLAESPEMTGITNEIKKLILN
jgi:chromosomal replication initiator protein